MNKYAMTAEEVADVLNVAKNTVYKLVKTGELNCYKVGRKMRFTYDDVQAYIQQSKSGRMPAANYAEYSAVDVSEHKEHPVEADKTNKKESGRFGICGQDEILDTLTRYLGRQMPSLAIERTRKGSYDSLIALYKDEVSVAASHMWDGETDTYNELYVRRLLPACPAVIIHLCKRTQGLYVAEGNPKNITSWEDFRRADLVVANREPGAGSRILLDEKLMALGIDSERIRGYQNRFYSHLAVAGQIIEGKADVGVGPGKTASSVNGIKFLPLQEERYDLIVKKRDFETEAVQTMLRILQSAEFQSEFRYLNGYELGKETGTYRFVP